MAAIKVRVLHLRPTLVRPNAYPLHHFSSSSDITPPQPQPPPPAPSQPSFSSQFNDVKATLRREPNRPQSFRKPSSFPNPNPNQSPPPPGIEPLEEIRRNLSAFRSRSPHPPPTSGPYVSFQELYKRNVISNPDNNPDSTTATPTNTVQSFDAIRESLRNLRASSTKNQNDSREKSFDPTSLARIRDTLNLKPDRNADQNRIIGGTDGLPSSIFGKEKISEGDDVDMRTAFVKMYDVDELGTKLKMLRPEKKKGKWFSLHELNERLAKLREIEEKEYKGRVGGASFKDLRDTLLQLKKSDDHKLKNRTAQRLGVLSQLGVTPSYMLSPPNDDLVEKYFHPDNMSSAEKLKLELKKVRDEFKMSESDCGSARVQVAQLTTKIKHLSTVLQKKDKHSRRGLQAMVQRRKKLLKYLRRTDWDSYSLVLSKLGLRDNPDIKA